MLINQLSRKFFLLIYGIFWLTSTGAQAFLLSPDNDKHPFGIIFSDEKPLVPADGKLRLSFQFFIPDTYYLYQDKFAVELDDPNIVIENLNLPEAERKYDPFSESEMNVYFDEVSFDVTLILPKDSQTTQVSGQLFYQGCSTDFCYRMMQQKFIFDVAQPIEDITVNSVSEESSRFWDGLPLAFFLGVLSSLSVCVLPLIPLTIAFMGISATQSRSKTFVTLAVFVLGVVSMNAPLGVMAAWLGLKLGFQYQNPWFLGFVTILFLFVGLWNLGVFQLQLPARWQTAVTRVTGNGLWRAWFSGLTIGLLSFACIGPFLLPLLTAVAASQNLVTGFLTMIFYAFGLSALFVGAAFFSTAWMRRFGEKSFWIKRITGWLMLVFAVYFGWVFVKAYVWKPDTTQTNQHHDFFMRDYAEAQRVAKEQNKSIILDFYADWCLPCQEWDLRIWSDDTVQQAVLKDFVPVKVDCTTDNAVCTELTEQFSVIGMPTVVFLRPDSTEIVSLKLVGVVPTPEQFIKHLAKNLEQSP